MKDHVLALDQGTTSSRAIVFDRRGLPVASAQRELPQIFPRDGWVEHDPAEIWSGQLACAREALARAGLDAARIAALGIANQRETTILWERSSGRALHNAIVWQDRRTAAHCAALREQGLEADIRGRTGLLLDPYFSATKIGWLLDNIPGARARAQAGELAFGTVDSWLAWNLTGGACHVTDPSNASRTLLFDLHRREWDEDLLARFGVPRALLPRVVPSGAVLGQTLPALLGAPVPIAALAGDQQSAAFGQACLRPGMAKNTYGTGCFLLLHAGATVPAGIGRGLLATAGCSRPGAQDTVFVEGAVFSGGSVVQWLRDGLGIIADAAAVEPLAASVPDSGGVVLVPAFTGLGAPDWDPHARGTIVGITRATGKAHIARAALEAIALQSAALLQAMQESGARLTELRVDGGASRNNLLLQMQADLLGVPVLRPRVTETTALGAAFLAGLATGFWSGEDEISALWQLERRFEPAQGEAWRSAMQDRWRRAVDRARGWAGNDPPLPR
jgi:glycerol kinase